MTISTEPAPAAAWREHPCLTGRYVELRPIQPEHAQALLTAADDDAVFAHLPYYRPLDLAQARAMVAKHLALKATGFQVPWVQVDASSGQVAGITTYYDIDPGARTLAIGSTWLGLAYQRTGLNTEAKLLLMARAFDLLGAVRVVWHTDIRNTQSQNAIARLGATREGVLRKHRLRKDGSWRDTVQFSMTDDDWPGVKLKLVAALQRTRP